MFLGNYNLMKLDGKELLNNTYLHLRYNRKLTKRIIWEAFTQVQSNKHRGYELRWLLGTGPRFRIHSTEKLALNSGVLYMYEYEVENNREAFLHEHRISSYLSFELELAEKLSLIHTSYYQPKINFFKDYRIQTQTNLKFKFTKKISFLLTYNLLYDEYPPKNVKHSNHYYLTELLIDL